MEPLVRPLVDVARSGLRVALAERKQPQKRTAAWVRARRPARTRTRTEPHSAHDSAADRASRIPEASCPAGLRPRMAASPRTGARFQGVAARSRQPAAPASPIEAVDLPLPHVGDKLDRHVQPSTGTSCGSDQPSPSKGRSPNSSSNSSCVTGACHNARATPRRSQRSPAPARRRPPCRTRRHSADRRSDHVADAGSTALRTRRLTTCASVRCPYTVGQRTQRLELRLTVR